MIDKMTVTADARRCWESADSGNLRAEFGDEFERYLSYRLACANGSVRVFGSRVDENGAITPRAAVIS